jgi:virulence-associated protein VagC
MKIIQKHEDGSAEIIFSDEEIEIIRKKKKLIFTPLSLKNFGNILVKTVSDWQLQFGKKLQKHISTDNNVKTK